MKDTERTIEVPTDDDENVGDVPKKKIKKKKSKEEREADRRAVFWTFLIILTITLLFWIWPIISNMRFGVPVFNFGKRNPVDEAEDLENVPKTEMKNYIEYKL